MFGLIIFLMAITIDAVVLVVLLNAFYQEQVELYIAAIIAFCSSLVAYFLLIGLTVSIGPVWGGLLTLLLFPLVLGFILSLLYGMELKRATLIGALFTILQILRVFMFSSLGMG